jgi:hypothetical protein
MARNLLFSEAKQAYSRWKRAQNFAIKFVQMRYGSKMAPFCNEEQQ